MQIHASSSRSVSHATLLWRPETNAFTLPVMLECHSTSSISSFSAAKKSLNKAEIKCRPPWKAAFQQKQPTEALCIGGKEALQELQGPLWQNDRPSLHMPTHLVSCHSDLMGAPASFPWPLLVGDKSFVAMAWHL
eukprot:1158927-Pelagomonas_calceolata.AAC.5